jgi:DHA1 family bicyclomycin/chloramphenicol resistance-like MFS transporter
MKSFIATLVLCFIVAHVQNDIIIPGFPDMILHFGTNARIFHFSSSSYALGVALGGLFLGAISDIYGRKRILYLGLFLIIIGCVGVIFSHNIYSYICFRFVEGVGASIPMIVCIAIVFDNFEKEKARNLVGFKNGILTLGKGFSPMLGSFLNVLLGWQYNFLVLVFLTIIAIILTYHYIPNDIQDSKNNQGKGVFAILKELFSFYRVLLLDKIMLSYIVVLGCMACVLLVYTLSASIIHITHLGVEKELYGFYQGAVWVVFGIFCFLCQYIIQLINEKNTKRLGFVLMIIGGLLFVFSAHLYATSLLITISMMVCAMGFALLITILFTEAMTRREKLKGATSSIIAFFRTMLVAITTAIAGLFHGDVIPLSYIIATLIFFVVTIYFFNLRKRS